LSGSGRTPPARSPKTCSSAFTAYRCVSTFARRTGEVTKVIERGTKSIDTMLDFMLFNIAPTILQLVIVAVIFYFTFGWGLVAATAVAVVAYIWVTRTITEWRSALRERMNRLDGQALSRAQWIGC